MKKFIVSALVVVFMIAVSGVAHAGVQIDKDKVEIPPNG